MNHAPPITPAVPIKVIPRFTFKFAECGLAALCLFLFFFRIGSIRLFDLDEALYVTCARQMLLTGDFITPRLNARPPARPQETTSPFFEKPILVYWCAALSMRLFGVSETAVRLPAASVALLTTGLVYFAGRRWFGRRSGLLAAAVYATAPMTLADARQMTTDGLLVLWVTIALLSFEALCSLPEADRRPSWLPFLCFWIACALAVLTKGAVGLLIPALVIGVYLLLDRLLCRLSWPRFAIEVRWNRFHFVMLCLRRLRPLPGFILLCILAVPWHYFVWKAGEHAPDGRTFYQEYIVHQHIGRFQGADTVHNMPLPTYLLYFLLGFFPWACFAPAAFRLRFSGTRKETVEDAGNEKPADHLHEKAYPPAPVVQFLLAWFWAIFLFYSLSAAKLPTYIVPAYPAAALLIGRWLDWAITARTGLRSLRRAVCGAWITAGILLFAVILIPILASKNATVPADVILVALHLTALLFLGCLIAGFFFFCQGDTERGRQAGVLALISTMATVIGAGVTEGYTVVEREVISPYQQIAEDARPDAMAGLPVIFYHIIPRRPSMLYYSRDYSPLERKETPLLPTLRSLLLPSGTEADVITSQDTLDKELRTEIAAVPDVTLTVLKQRNGWVLLRLRLH